jgi:hypothetical protein
MANSLITSRAFITFHLAGCVRDEPLISIRRKNLTHKSSTRLVPVRRNVLLDITSHTDEDNAANEPDAKHSHKIVADEPAGLVVGREQTANGQDDGAFGEAEGEDGEDLGCKGGFRDDVLRVKCQKLRRQAESIVEGNKECGVLSEGEDLLSRLTTTLRIECVVGRHYLSSHQNEIFWSQHMPSDDCPSEDDNGRDDEPDDGNDP